MATVYQNLFVNVSEKRLQVSDINGGEVRLGDLFKYMTLPLKVVLVEQDPQGEVGQYERKSVGNLSLRISVNDTLDDASPLAQQTSWAADSGNNHLTGLLDLNTAGLNSYVGSSTMVSAYFQIEFSESGGGYTPVYQQQITIRNSITQPTTTSPNPVNTYRTAAEGDLVYDTPIMRQGIQKVIISANGSWQRILGIDDNGTRIDDVLPYP